MKRKWKDIKWIFEPDGSLRDMYVQDITLREWDKFIDYLNHNVRLSYSGEEKIDKEYVLNYLRDTTRELESKSLTIHLDEIKLNCHFFLAGQIELDIDPKEINSITDFEMIEEFMTAISALLNEQVTLTAENTPEFPLFKVDVKNRINKALSEKEALTMAGTKNGLPGNLSVLQTKLETASFPDHFKSRLMESATREYKPTGKEKNLW